MVLPGGVGRADSASSGGGTPALIVGTIRSITGASSVVRADGAPACAEVGISLFQGDQIETGADGRMAITFVDGSVFHLSNGTRLTLSGFARDSENALRSAQVEVTQGQFAFVAGRSAGRGGFTIETPFATIRGAAGAGALATLTLAGFTIALLKDLHAASNEPILLDDLINYKDLHHGTLLIAPRGGQPGIVLDDPEMTIVIGPPDTGFLVQQIMNSGAIMAMLLGFSDAVNATYQLGLADPLTTGSTGGPRTQLFFPESPSTNNSSNTGLLPPLPDENNNPPPPPPPNNNNPQPILALKLNEDLVLSHDHTVQVDPGSDDTHDPFPLNLGGLPNPPQLVIGQATDGTAADPFVSTAGSSGPVLITLEPSFNGVDSGLDVTGGGSIFLYKEFADGEQIVVGREGGPNGPIAFVLFVTPDGQSLWVQEYLPIQHTDPADSPTNIPNDPDSIASILSEALLVRGTLIGVGLTQTFPIGEHIEFVDDAPDAKDDEPQEVAEALSIGGNVINPELADDPNGFGKDDPGTDGATLTHVKLPGSAVFVAIDTGVEDQPGIFTFPTDVGVFTFQADGTWTFTAATNLDNLLVPVDASFSYRLTDGDGDFDDATQPISVVDGADPTGGQLGLLVLEPDLDGGTTPGGTGEVISGLLSFTAGSDDITSFEFGDTSGIVIQGLLGSPAIEWVGEGTDTIIGKINGSPAISLTVTGATIGALETGSVTVTATLLEGFPHALLGADSVLIGGIKVKAVEDDGDFGLGQVRVRVLDDVPIANDDEGTPELGSPLTNVIIVLDRSGSMGGASGVPGLSRFELARLAAINLLSTGNIGQVLIVSFAGTAESHGWFSQDDAISFLSNYQPPISGESDYDDAIALVQTAYGSPPEADRTHSYFFSDGAPTAGDTISNAEQSDWEDFLDDNGITSFAVGTGSGISANDADLHDVAYPGNPIVISSAADPGLLATLAAPFATVSGNVLANDSPGADGLGEIVSITVDGSVYTFDGTDVLKDGSLYQSATSILVVTTTLGGTLEFDFETGDWEYTAPGTTPANPESFTYVIADNDGDLDDAVLQINFAPGPEPEHAPTINAPSVIRFWSTGSGGDKTAINRVNFQDADGDGVVRVTFVSNNNNDAFTAANLAGSGVGVVSGAGTASIVLEGTMSDINAWLAGNNLLWNPEGTSNTVNRSISVTIDDNGGAPDGHVITKQITLNGISPSFSGTSNNNFSDTNFWGITDQPDAGGSNDTIVTSWVHLSSAGVEYDGGSSPDTVTVVFSAAQLEDILTGATQANSLSQLQAYFDGSPGGTLNLLDSAWNASVTNFGTSNIAIANSAGKGIVSLNSIMLDVPNDTNPNGGPDLVIGTGTGETLDGLGGNDVILGLGGDDTLIGGSGSDLLLGGDGADVLVGGLGNDVLAGGADADTFRFGEHGAGNIDAILDYSFVEGDVIHLDATLAAVFGDDPGRVRLQQTGSGDVLVQIDTTGAGNWSDMVNLSGYGTSFADPVKIMIDASLQTYVV